MKRKLLYLTTILLFSVFLTNAQTKTWDFGTVAGGWTSPNTVGYTTNVVIDNLGIYPAEAAAPTSIGQVDNNNTTFAGTGGFSATQRFKMGGVSTVVGNKPTVRYLYFAAAGSGTLTIWFRGGNSTTTRSITVSDGTNVLATQASVNGANVTMVVPYTSISGNIYIYNDLACNIYRMEVVGPLGTTALIPALGVDDFQAEASSNVFSNGKLVFVSNVKSDTQVDVYGISGVLVKSFKTGSDTSFDLNTGIYVVKSKSAEGEKSAKVLVN